MKDRAPGRGLFDTSVFVAIENGRELRKDAIPDSAAISVVTTAELRAGVFAAADIPTRDRRIRTLEMAARITALPVGDEVARVWAQMRAYLAASERRRRANDLWIAATAAAYELPLVTQDADFDAVNGVAGLTVIPV
jgi:predicted nucleic acid-binding protein